jgi:hypothetical protein
MKNPASAIALIFPAIGAILIAIGGFMYFQGANTPEIDPLDLWLGPAIAGGTGLIFLAIGGVLYFAGRTGGSKEHHDQKLQSARFAGSGEKG